MGRKRMRENGDDRPLAIEGSVAVRGMVPSFFARHPGDKSVSTLSGVLVGLLNGDDLKHDYRDRAVRIVQLLKSQRAFDSYALDARRAGEPVMSAMVEAYTMCLLNCTDELNGKLQRYKITPQFFPVSGSAAIVYFLPAELSGSSPEFEAEIGAVMCALQLAQHGQIDNVRECSCGTFFVAGRIDQNHCSTKCRVRAHQSSDEFKSRRREADRERYRLHKDGKVKETNRRKSNGSQKAR